ncbi:MAG: response regulator [Deltaproteobacteria bacterium]|nr:response regulator [Deltaproteobacteria bacterium]
MISHEDLLNARIMIVDDKEENVQLLEQMLQKQGYTSILGISDSRDVIELYPGYLPDVVLLDINMPHLDGFEVLRQIKDFDAEDIPPVLILTAQQDRDTMLKALESGARDFLSKPFDRVEALCRIRNVIEVRHSQNQIRNQKDILEKMVQERTQELNETRLEIIRRLGLAAEYRDNETGLHIIRMSKMSQIIGLGAGMLPSEAELLLNASPMHDIGKIGIPDRVLIKPGKLDAEEWEIMKTHAAIGGEMLKGHSSPLLKMAQDVAISHHEKWDGSGYPHGLKGEEIPLVGRVCAVADVFDALTSTRPYKKAWPIQEAVDLIVKDKGTHFDPKLVEVFHNKLDDLIMIKELHSEP